jgi:hypothetical protein
VITFAGRPLDSAKGLFFYLGAISLLFEIDELPCFHAWIIGGSKEEIKTISRFIDSSNGLKALADTGRIKLWGKIAFDALPEFYSRSSIVVMPSQFETFGRVAVEAMACGCPLAAANIPGLNETVLDGVTGILFEPDNSMALSCILADCLRWPRRFSACSQKSRNWTRQIFSIEKSFGTILKLYNKEPINNNITLDWWKKGPRTRFYDSQKEIFLHPVERLLESIVDTYRHLPSLKHHAALVKTFDIDAIVVKFDNLGDGEPGIVPPALELRGSRNPHFFYRKALFLGKDCPLTPGILSTDDQEAMVIFKLPAKKKINNHQPLTSINQSLIEYFRDISRKIPDENEKNLSRFHSTALSFSKQPCDRTLQDFDSAAADLNAPLNNGIRLYQPYHPQAEIFRFINMLRGSYFNLPPSFISSSGMLLDFLWNKIPFINEKPILQYGGLPDYCQPIPTVEPMVLSFDECGFFVGPYDRAFYLSQQLIEGKPLSDISRDIQRSFGDKTVTGILAQLWLSLLIVFDALKKAARGKIRSLETISPILEELLQQWNNRDYDLNRSPGNADNL